jgi:hypothetical protein
MFFLPLNDLILLILFLSIILIIPAQLLFTSSDLELNINKKRFRTIAQIIGVLSIIILCVQTYLALLA